MRYGSDVYFNPGADGISWSQATGALSPLPLDDYPNGYQMYALGASDDGGVGIILAYGIDATNGLHGIVYYTTDGMNWSEAFRDRVAGAGGAGTSFNAGMVFFDGEFLTDMWPLVGGSNSEDVLPLTTAAGYPVKFNGRAANAAATTGGLVAIGNGTIGFLSGIVYTSPDGIEWTELPWSE